MKEFKAENDLKNMPKDELIKLLLKQNKKLDASRNVRLLNWVNKYILSKNEKHLENVKTLLKEGASVDYYGENGLTALHRACKAGDLNLVKALVELGKPTDLKSKNDKTRGFHALHMAVLGDNPELIDYLCADYHSVNSDKIKDFKYTWRLSENEPNAFNTHSPSPDNFGLGISPLHIACITKTLHPYGNRNAVKKTIHPHLVIKLLKYGAAPKQRHRNIKFPDIIDHTDKHSFRESKELRKILFSADKIDRNPNKFLEQGITNNSELMVYAALEFGADLKHKINIRKGWFSKESVTLIQLAKNKNASLSAKLRHPSLKKIIDSIQSDEIVKLLNGYDNKLNNVQVEDKEIKEPAHVEGEMKIKNFAIEKNRKPREREGSIVYNNPKYRINIHEYPIASEIDDWSNYQAEAQVGEKIEANKKGIKFQNIPLRKEGEPFAKEELKQEYRPEQLLSAI